MADDEGWEARITARSARRADLTVAAARRAEDFDRTLHRALIVALWASWSALVGMWLPVSWYELKVHHDSGSFIGGGIVVAVFTVLLAVGLWLARRWWTAEQQRRVGRG